MPAMDARRRRPRTLPLTARRRRWSSVRRSRRDGCAARRNSVLLKQVLDDRLLLSIDPTGKEQTEEGERRRQRIHGESVPEGLGQFKDLTSVGRRWAEFPEVQPLADCGDPSNIG